MRIKIEWLGGADEVNTAEEEVDFMAYFPSNETGQAVIDRLENEPVVFWRSDEDPAVGEDAPCYVIRVTKLSDMGEVPEESGWRAVPVESIEQEVRYLDAFIETVKPVIATGLIWQLELIRDRLKALPAQMPTVEKPV